MFATYRPAAMEAVWLPWPELSLGDLKDTTFLSESEPPPPSSASYPLM
ncbi:Subtilisin-like protease SBT1.5 [Senna tora]|uniref:Subtilisin-like protease SBT1.5 n=1 Tax=Senna tora TaxID=362788 RepID=A0A834SX73_9FABA|nr:Subtilisin-like protease SBT1.5 [Senna tora]